MTAVLVGKWCISIVGGHELWREAICVLLSRVMPNATVFEAPDGSDHVFNDGYVDLMLFCLSPPYLSGLEQLLQLRRRFPIVPLILVSDAEDSIAGLAMRTCGANSFLRASASIEDLLTMITDVLDGKMALRIHSRSVRAGGFHLSPRQMEVFVLLCQGRTNKEIGSVLGVSGNTVRTHVSAIFDLLGVRNRTEAATLGRNLIGISLCLLAALARYHNLALQLA